MKKFIDKDTHDYILQILNANGINKAIIETAKNMDVDLVQMFYEKIVNVKDNKKLEINKDVIVKCLLGVYGNFIATSYYKSLGYNVINELPIKNEVGKEITKADIAFKLPDGAYELCEVKTTPYIIDNIRNFPSDKEEKYNDKFYYDMDNDIIKYKEIGKKLINQVKKLKTSTNNVTIIIFKECFIDDLIKDELNKLGVKVQIILPDINELKENIESIVLNVVRTLKEEKTNIIFYNFKNAA